MYSSYSFTTSALDGGEWSASRPVRALPPGKGPTVPIVQEAGWASEPVWTQKLQEKSFCPCRWSNLDRPVVQSVVRHYTAWANPAPHSILRPGLMSLCSPQMRKNTKKLCHGICFAVTQKPWVMHKSKCGYEFYGHILWMTGQKYHIFRSSYK
jgi:hypothetical protein